MNRPRRLVRVRGPRRARIPRRDDVHALRATAAREPRMVKPARDVPPPKPKPQPQWRRDRGFSRNRPAECIDATREARRVSSLAWSHDLPSLCASRF